MSLAIKQRFSYVLPDASRPLIAVLTVFCFVVLSTLAFVENASAETRTLRIYYTHTKESAKITFKKNGKYVSSGLKKLNRILRDFRRNEPTRMDPELFDLVWEVYQKSGSKKPIHVISGYRSPRTNNMLRRRGRKVAKNSQHTRGKALDFFLPDVPVTKLRALGLRAHGGGVGYYRGSFVHLDTGRVRHWPRMSRKQLVRVFPKGRTLHVPSDGRRLKGYKTAAANLKKGLNYDGTPRKTKANATLLARMFKKSGDDGDETEGKPSTAKLKPVPKPKPAKPATAKVAKKPSGPDPFALELAAAQKVQAEEVKKEALKPAAEPEAVPVQEEQIAVAAITVPVRRPKAPVPQVNEPEVQLAVVSEERLSPSAATELVLAAPEEPSVIVAALEPVPEPAKPKVSAENLDAINDLKSRIRTALARQRQLTAAERAAEAQANMVLASKLAKLPVSSSLSSGFQSAALPAARPSGESSFQVPTPEWRVQPDGADQSEQQVAALPQAELPAAKPPKPKAAKSAPRIIPDLEGELKLGDLDGRDVRAWAVATTTRVGPIAALSAPRYGQGTRRAAPLSVYSAGFANNRPPLRADRFSGRALTRVAFAYFTNN